MLMVLSLFVNGVEPIFYMKFIDTTGDGYTLAHLFQNDGFSSRYIKTLNFSEPKPHTIGTDHNYSLVIEPTTKGIYKDIGGENLLSYLYHNFWFMAFIIGIVITIMSVAYMIIVRGRRFR